MQSPVPLHDKCKRPFRFTVTDQLMEQLHTLDLTKHGSEGIPEEITDSKTRDRYLVSSLIEEAITSSQLEGAVTTRQVAKEMIRNSRRPRDKDERMIMNNYLTMQYIRERKDEPLTPEMVLDIHRQVTDGTMPDPLIPGRLRTEQVEVRYQGKVIHSPPPAGELVERMHEMCFFANAHSPAYFIHPVARAIILHFWLAYDHPFMDGNGRTARALFYWALLHNGYWLFEFLPISPILRKEPTRYYRSFLLTETDDNDLTYFLIAQAQVIEKAIAELHTYIRHKKAEASQMELPVQAQQFNHRQLALLQHALRQGGSYTFDSHRKYHDVTYQTARTDLLGLAKHNLLEPRKQGKQIVFVPPADLAECLQKLEWKTDG